jgi:sorting nexin-13
MRTVGQAVRTMPDNLMSTVDGVMDGINKVFQGKAIRPPGFCESMKVGASLHVDVSTCNEWTDMLGILRHV